MDDKHKTKVANIYTYMRERSNSLPVQQKTNKRMREENQEEEKEDLARLIKSLSKEIKDLTRHAEAQNTKSEIKKGSKIISRQIDEISQKYNMMPTCTATAKTRALNIGTRNQDKHLISEESMEKVNKLQETKETKKTGSQTTEPWWPLQTLN